MTLNPKTRELLEQRIAERFGSCVSCRHGGWGGTCNVHENAAHVACEVLEEMLEPLAVAHRRPGGTWRLHVMPCIFREHRALYRIKEEP